MHHMWDGIPTCTYFDNPEYPETRCTRVANYVIIKPPQAFKPTPTRVYTADENPTARHVQRRAYPTHCQEHAYFFCGLTVGGGESMPPPPRGKGRGTRANA